MYLALQVVRNTKDALTIDNQAFGGRHIFVTFL